MIALLSFKVDFFKARIFFNLDCNNLCKNEIECNNEKISSRFTNTVTHKIDFTTNRSHRDHPPALMSNFTLRQIFVDQSKNNTDFAPTIT